MPEADTTKTKTTTIETNYLLTAVVPCPSKSHQILERASPQRFHYAQSSPQVLLGTSVKLNFIAN